MAAPTSVWDEKNDEKEFNTGPLKQIQNIHQMKENKTKLNKSVQQLVSALCNVKATVTERMKEGRKKKFFINILNLSPVWDAFECFPEGAGGLLWKRHCHVSECCWYERSLNRSCCKKKKKKQ